MNDLSGTEGSHGYWCTGVWYEFSLNWKEQAETFAAKGNNPEEWRAYIEFLKERIDLLEDGKKNKLLSHLYRTAIKAIPESCKTLAKAKLMIDFAELQRRLDPKDEEKILSMGRRTLRHHSVIHIACADLELKKGNKDKALRILQQALAIGSDPTDIIHATMDRITQVGNLESSFSPDSGKDSSGEMTGSQLSGHFEREHVRHAIPGRLNTQEFQQGLDLATQSLGQQSLSTSNQSQSYHSLYQNHARGAHHASSHSQHDSSHSQLYASQPQIPTSQPQIPTSQPQHYAFQPSHSQSEPDGEGSTQKSLFQKPPSPPKLLSFQMKNAPDNRSHMGLRGSVSSGTLQPNSENYAFQPSYSQSEPDREASTQKSQFQKPPSPPKLHSIHMEDTPNKRSHMGLRGSVSSGTLQPPSLTTPGPQPLGQHNGDIDPPQQGFGRFNSFSGSGDRAAKNSASGEIKLDRGKKWPMGMGAPRRVPKKLVEVEEEIGDITVSAFMPLGPLKAATIDLAEIPTRIEENKENFNLPHPGANHPDLPCADVYMESPAKPKPQTARLAPTKQEPQPQQPPVEQPKHELQPPVQQQPSAGSLFTPAKPPTHPKGGTYAVNLPFPTPAQPTPASKKVQKTKQVNNKTYTVIKLAGRGGSAKVFQVLDIEEGCLKALKVVDLSGVNQCILEGYMNEIGLLQKLGPCDRVINLFDWEYCESSQKLLMVLEYGETDLDNFIAKGKNSTSPFTVGYFWWQMVNAVNAMHKEGVIHSDLKPANFILVSGQVKLIDFGIAKALQTDKTSMLKETVVGTPSYMSPEQMIASNADPTAVKTQYKVGVRSDVWSLGCILYMMVYGKTPFQHVRNKIQAIINPAHVIQFPEGPNPDLLDVLKKCLTRDVSQRLNTNEVLQHPYFSTQMR